MPPQISLPLLKLFDENKKQYLAVLFFNVPAISYAAVGGLSFKLLNFQILFGVSFSAMGYLGSVWTFGIPLGGMYWLYKLKQRKESEVFNQQMDTANDDKTVSDITDS